MLYLYFGKTEDDLKNFALRDLGIIRTNKNANLSARFDTCQHHPVDGNQF
jgi:DNA polymerase-3 subunit epsilon